MSNIHEETLKLSIEPRELPGVVKALLHTLVFHRCNGEIVPKDATCDYVHVTYPTCRSDTLRKRIDGITMAFCKDLAQARATKGQLKVSFYLLKKGFFRREKIVWETWSLEFDVGNETFDSEHKTYLSRLADSLTNALSHMSSQILKRFEQLPLDVKDTDLWDSSPEGVYLFDVEVNFGQTSQGTWDVAKRMILDVFSSS